MSLFDNIGSFLPGVGNPFGLPSKGQWNLQQGSFQPDNGQIVTFFVESAIGAFPGQTTAMENIADTGSRRLSIYEYPYIDGQAIDDLGRKGERFVMNIKFFGANYQSLYKTFIEEVTKNNKKGKLVHPVRGAFTARLLDWEFTHKAEEWNAVTIKATFIEDSTSQISNVNVFDNINSLLRTGLQVFATVSTAVTQAISTFQAIKSFPDSLIASLKKDLKALEITISSLLGNVAATYSSDAQLQALFTSAQATGNVLATNTGTVLTSTAAPSGQLPPVFQVGYATGDQSTINAQIAAFVNSNQITSRQLLFQTNQVRAQISAAIVNVNTVAGNQAYPLVLQYRILAVQLQTVSQAALSASQALVKNYVVPYDMSLRMVAFKNGLSPDSQNAIENLNSFVQSVNYVSRGTILTVPTS